MKLDKIKFARLIGIITHIANRTLDEDEIDVINHVAEIIVPDPVQGMAPFSEVDRLLFLMAQGTQKIEAIKCYRTMTGQGLKEAKDAVEKYWVSKPIEGGATLGDILGKVK